MSLPLWMIVRGSADGEPEARRHVGAGRPQEALLVLPVAIGPAGVAVVLHVEDRDMGAVQDLAAAIDDVPQLYAAAGIAGRRRRAHGGEGPIDRRAAADGDGVAARYPLARGGLESRGRRPAHRPQSGDGDVRCARREPLGRPAGQVDADDLVRGVVARQPRQQAHRDQPAPTVPASQHRGHRPVGDQLAGTQARPELPIGQQGIARLDPFGRRRVGLDVPDVLTVGHGVAEPALEDQRTL